MQEFTHFNPSGEAHMVDVGEKAETARLARAAGVISMQKETFELVVQGRAGKGDVLGVARIAGIMAAKKTGELIPLCHPLYLTHVEIEFRPDAEKSLIRCIAICETTGRTGVEMEAMTAVSVALLTVYDMCKAKDRGMKIGDIRLLEKKGGKSGHWRGE